MEPIERKPDSHQAPTRQPGSTCSYCGTPLNGFYYFCTNCGKPYRPWQETVPTPLPPVMDDERRIQRSAPHAITLFFVYLLGILLSALFAFAFFRDVRPDLVLLLAVTVIFLITCVYTVMFWWTLAPQLTKPHRLFHPFALAGYALLGVVLGINYLYHVVMLGGDEIRFFDPLREGGLGYMTLILLFCVFPAVTEEVAFRGLLQHWLTQAIEPTRAILLASALFAAVHLSVISFPYLLLVGLLLGWVYHRTQSLYPPMLIHFLHNYAIIAVTYGAG